MPSKRVTKPLEGVSFAEFARIINRTKGYISQLKSANRLVLTADGKRVLVEESKARIKATSDPGKWPLTIAHEAERKRKAEPEVEEKAKPYAEIDISQIDLEVTDADTLFKNARAVKEKSLALQAKAEHDLFVGTLVKIADVERGIFEVVRQMRDGLMNVSRRIATEVVGLSDAGQCEKVIDREHRILLEALARGFAEKFR